MTTPAESAQAVSPVDRVRALFARQQAQRWKMSATRAEERADRLLRLRSEIHARRERLCAAVHADFGKPAAEFEITEILPLLEEINHAVKHLESWMRPRTVSTPVTLLGAHSEVRYEAKGVVLVLSPWNYPFALAVTPIVAAVAAGNCVMLRPSEKTPRMSEEIRALLAAVFPEEEVCAVLGGRAVADALLDLPFDHIFFTGSPAIGRKVMACAAKHLVPVTLELGGKSPAIVAPSADVVAAAQRITWGKFINGGQTCVAPDYVLVHEPLLPSFLVALKQAIERSYGATPHERVTSSDLCRIVDDGSWVRLDAVLKESVAQGARLEIGGEVDRATRRISPAVLTGVTPDSPIMKDEIFGPILPVLTFRSLEEALALVRSRPKPLALYVFGRERGEIETVLGGTSAGGSCVNNVVLHLGNPELPFGGVGESGMGQYHGRFGFETFSHVRAVLVQKHRPVAQMLYPPYGSRVEKLLAWVRRIAG